MILCVLKHHVHQFLHQSHFYIFITLCGRHDGFHFLHAFQPKKKKKKIGPCLCSPPQPAGKGDRDVITLKKKTQKKTFTAQWSQENSDQFSKLFSAQTWCERVPTKSQQKQTWRNKKWLLRTNSSLLPCVIKWKSRILDFFFRFASDKGVPKIGTIVEKAFGLQNSLLTINFVRRKIVSIYKEP